MRKFIILSFAALTLSVGLWAQEIDAVKFEQGQTIDWYLLADNPEVTFTDHNPVINGKTYDLANGNVETTFGTAPEDTWYTVREGMTINDYGTLCWKYNFTAIEGAELYSVAGLENNRIILQEVLANETQAGAGYVIYATAETLRVKNGDQHVETPVPAASNHGLQGTFEGITDGAAGANGNTLEGNYIIYQNEWHKCGAYTGLKANRAYLKMCAVPNGVSQAPNRKYISMPLPKQTPTDNSSLHHSINSSCKMIKDGRFIIIKNGEVRDIMGNRVK